MADTHSRIVQIVPAVDAVAVYRDERRTETHQRVVLWALTKDGDVIPLVVDESGLPSNPRDAANFDRVVVTRG